MLVKFEQNRMIQTTRNFDLFDKNQVFKKHFDKALTPFILEDVSVTETII